MKIKMSEVLSQKESLASSISSAKSQLESASRKLKSTADSDALQGNVKEAIDNKITNYQVPLLTNYVNSLAVISQGYDNLISTFKETVSETSDSAIIDTDVLQQMVDKFDSPLEQLKTCSDEINKAIDEVADIVSLTKVTTADAISEFKSAKKVLTNTIKDMGVFNSTVFTSEAGDILEEQNTQLSSLSDLGSSSYTSKKAKDFYKDSTFKAEVKEVKSVVNGKARRDQLKNALAKNLYDSKYSGYLLEKNPKEIRVPTIFNNDLTTGILTGSTEELSKYKISSLDDSMPNIDDYMHYYVNKDSYFGNTNLSMTFNQSDYIDLATYSAIKRALKTVTVSEYSLPIVGTTASIGLSGISSLFMGIDFASNLSEENAGRAFVHTATTTTATALGVSALEVGIGTAALSGSGMATAASLAIASNPVGWAIGAGVAVGFGVSIAYNNNFLGIKDIANDMGDYLNNDFKNIGKFFDSSVKSIQKVFWGR
ncbi:T7SS effector LXG polymorphic toxin [Streptococcus gallolyticus]|uniref:T7SS effector LXG polymorphic toxin n=1 Tax=Streptococcus gallolyticus TaxID=315405 RepID=UPI00228391F3|nr:T7SS effector LXG polymorphic toxin [Streptococcus gallolyticus]MCY7191861.1 LXG domain-containing protein [Streptococcus gallolyticus subsp. gallolyticus]